MAKNLDKWLVAQKKFRLSDKHIQMARELGLNPDKFGKLNNHNQERWKAPLPEFIENIYYKRFKLLSPVVIKPVKQIIAEKKTKQLQKKLEKKNAADTTSEDHQTSWKSIDIDIEF